MNIRHYGLTFTMEHVQAAQKVRETPPLAGAWAYLKGHEQSGAAAALWGGLRSRFNGDARAAAFGIEMLIQHADPQKMEDLPVTDAAGETVMLTHAYEMLRDHAAFTAGDDVRWREALHERIGALNANASRDIVHEYLWVNAANLAAGIALEREPIIELAAQVFREAVADEIRPQGHIARAVSGDDGGAMHRHLLAAGALVLTAEMGAHVGLDLWDHALRGVSVMTAAIFPIYYFYTTAKWKWDAGITPEEVQALFARHGGYLEMVNRRAPSKDLATVLNDLRPVFDPYGGGLTTLTHGTVGRRRGLFG